MTTEDKLKRRLHWINFTLLLITLLALYGLMSFGRGLGDLFFVIGLGVFVLANTTLTIFAKNKLLLSILFIISIVVLGGTIWSTTIGRGAEYRWNGNIFKN